ncbi:hypothetical protein BABINDRAFT_163286 [Babjeviella inositovora NRRL Y-12698]|uniref:Adenylate cyclase n=1 Tax=Babjeviella inositovora NRRL Y-12698 TaxID=984486 RepID=A0A1E3QJP2_9ASCO|nr:uncharacterized protein BABINDRAFT_163286 [Babjeviella inositovora NRRL Y-12698]ODQ77915.1 hypothetical protein BABINDRAFT_163286 [Babjeviella inositovora NRRL Y-12698]
MSNRPTSSIVEQLTSPNTSPPSRITNEDNIATVTVDFSGYQNAENSVVPHFNDKYTEQPTTPVFGSFPQGRQASVIASPTTTTATSPDPVRMSNLGGVPDNYRGFHAKPHITDTFQKLPPKKRSSILSKFLYARKDSEAGPIENTSSNTGINDPNQLKPSAVSSIAKRLSKARHLSLAEVLSHSMDGAKGPRHASIGPLNVNRAQLQGFLQPAALEKARPELSHKPKSLPLSTREGTPTLTDTGSLHVFQLDTNLSEMAGIVGPPGSIPRAPSSDFNHLRSEDNTAAFRVSARHGSKVEELVVAEPQSSATLLASGWLAPESWDVKAGLDGDKSPAIRKDSATSTGSSDSQTLQFDSRRHGSFSSALGPYLDAPVQVVFGNRRAITPTSPTTVNGGPSMTMSPMDLPFNQLRKNSDVPSLGSESGPGSRRGGSVSSATPSQSITKKIPTASTGHVATSTKKLSQVGNYIIRVFREDNTFATLLCSFDTCEAELLAMAGRKFFIPDISNYLIGLRIGRLTKVLDPNSRPVTIQSQLLLLSGYSERDNLRIIGREDLSFLYKFVLVKNELRKLTDEEHDVIRRDPLYVNLRNMNLKTIPIVLYDHAFELESLDVSNNASMTIPLDFLQTCDKLKSVSFVNNRAATFPTNLLEIRTLARLDLERNFIREVPERIHLLSSLTTLELKCNRLSALPDSIAQLKNLKTLNLSSNNFSVFPEPITKLPKLLQLDLSYNSLTHLPDSIAGLTKLEKLDLSTNSLSHGLPLAFKSLVSLQSLNIKYNKLSNIDVLGSLPKLEVLYSTKNKVSQFSDRMDKLRMFHLDRNPITDLQFENVLPSLAVLNLSGAKITSLPVEFIAKIPNIEKLVLDKNHLVSMPSEIGRLSKLVYLSCYANNLESIPAEIGGLTSLQYLDLHSNNLQALPESIWQLSSLYILNLSSNSLDSFPRPTPVMGRAHSAVSLAQMKASFSDLSARRLSDWSQSSTLAGPNSSRRNSAAAPLTALSKKKGSISSASDERSSWTNDQQQTLAESLLVLKMGDNNLSDEIFESVSLLTELKTLDLSYNELIEIPNGALRRMSKLTNLYLSGNELASLPADDFEYLKALKTLHLNGNKLHALPAELGKIKHLQVLDVGSNHLKYNISNWPYDWNWHWNLDLKYLNFSGNKRLEIRQSHLNSRYGESNENLDDFTVLKKLRILGLVDVTVTTPLVPDESYDLRVRTTATEFGNIGYGIADTLGSRDNVSTRDLLIERFRGNDDEILVAIYDGKNDSPKSGHKIAKLIQETFSTILADELGKVKSTETIPDGIRRAFLRTNKEINTLVMLRSEDGFVNSVLAHQSSTSTVIDEKDVFTGCCMTVAFIKDKKLYTANIGDTMALLARGNGEYVTLAVKHDPTKRHEFERIRAGGGYVSSNGMVDGVVDVSRAIGFVDLLPHIHAGPDISEVDITYTDESIIIATKSLWDHIAYEVAVDIIRREKDAMLAAQKLRDYAISYGSNEKITVIVISLGKQKTKSSLSAISSTFNEEELLMTKKRRDRSVFPEDSTLRRLEEEIPPPMGELALVFTDIKNSTTLWDTVPIAMRSAIKIHNKVMRRQLRIVGGYEVKTEGDAFMVSFPTPSSALLWCLNVQLQLLREDWPAEILSSSEGHEVTDAEGNVIYRGISVRMGAHWGSPVCERDIITRRMDYFGPMVNRASRVSATADGGQITLSTDFFNEWKKIYAAHKKLEKEHLSYGEAYGDDAFGELLDREAAAIETIGYKFEELGEKKLKGLETPEFIHMIYPEKLIGRFSFNDDDLQQSVIQRNMEGFFNPEFTNSLRSTSLRLEAISASIHDPSQEYKKQSTFSSYTNEVIKKRMPGIDTITFLNHVITRIENSVALLQLRQSVNQAMHGTGLLQAPNSSSDVFDLVDQLGAILQLANKANVLPVPIGNQRDKKVDELDES